MEKSVARWVMISSLDLKHEFESIEDSDVRLTIVSEDSKIIEKMQKLFGSDVIVYKSRQIRQRGGDD